MVSLKERVGNALSRSGLLQKDLAAKSGVSAPTISSILRGSQPRYDTYLKIDSALTEIERASRRRRRKSGAETAQ